MYDHNQTLVPDSFVTLFVRGGRLTATRRQIEQRYELAEDLALHIADMPDVATAADDRLEQAAALDRCRAGLLASPEQVFKTEADWIIRRVAELRGQDRVSWCPGHR